MERTMANENFSQIGLDKSIYGVLTAWEHSRVLPSQHLVLRTFQWAGFPACVVFRRWDESTAEPDLSYGCTKCDNAPDDGTDIP